MITLFYKLFFFLILLIGLVTNVSSVEIESSEPPYYNNVTYPASNAFFLQNNLTYYLFSDQEVAAYLDLYSISQETNLLLPYDALGAEYMTLAYKTGTIDYRCRLIGHEGEIDVWIFTPTGNTTLLRDIQDVTVELSEQTGTVFRSRSGKPFAVFCGSYRSSDSASLNQLPPVSGWGTRYQTPALGTLIQTTNFQTKLKIVTNSDSTVLEVEGHANSITTLNNRGDSTEIDIDASKSYNIKSSHPVLVGMLIFRTTDLSSNAFKILPAVENFADSPVLYSYSLIPNTPNPADGVTVTDENGQQTTTFLPGINDEKHFFYEANDTKVFSMALMFALDRVKLVPSTTLHKDFTEVSSKLPVSKNLLNRPIKQRA